VSWAIANDENFPEKFKSENFREIFLENFPPHITTADWTTGKFLYPCSVHGPAFCCKWLILLHMASVFENIL
jgi:hypothetical protein